MQNFKCLQNAFNMALKTNSQFRVGDWTVKPVDDETISVKYLNRQIAKISTSEYSNYAELKLFSLYQRLGEDSPAFLYTACKACKDFGIEIWCDDFFQWGRYDFELPQAGGAVIPFGSHDIKRLEILSDDKHVATITPALLGSLCRSECAFAFNDDVLKGVLLFQKTDTSETEVVSADIARKYIEKLACEQELSFECYRWKEAYKVHDGKIFTTDFWQRKYHMEIPIGGGLLYNGFINVEAPVREALPKAEDLRGTFWIEKTEEGWNGKFQLAPEFSYVDSTGLYGVYTTGVYREEDPALTAKLDGHFDPVIAQMLWERSQPVKLETMSRMEGRLEDYIRHDVNETHHWTREYEPSECMYYENPIPRYMRQAVKNMESIDERMS